MHSPGSHSQSTNPRFFGLFLYRLMKAVLGAFSQDLLYHFLDFLLEVKIAFF